jgi:hypothetical protein
MLRFLNLFLNFGGNKRHHVVLVPSQTVDPQWVPRALVRSKRAKLGVTQGRLGSSDSAGAMSTSASNFMSIECRRQAKFSPNCVRPAGLTVEAPDRVLVSPGG